MRPVACNLPKSIFPTRRSQLNKSYFSPFGRIFFFLVKPALRGWPLIMQYIVQVYENRLQVGGKREQCLWTFDFNLSILQPTGKTSAGRSFNSERQIFKKLFHGRCIYSQGHYYNLPLNLGVPLAEGNFKVTIKSFL